MMREVEQKKNKEKKKTRVFFNITHTKKKSNFTFHFNQVHHWRKKNKPNKAEQISSSTHSSFCLLVVLFMPTSLCNITQYLNL